MNYIIIKIKNVQKIGFGFNIKIFILFMNILINNNIYFSKYIQINCFTEYGLQFKKINTLLLPDNINKSNITINSLLLLPFTHINNIWHLLHQLFISYKYIKKNSLEKYKKNIYFIFFPQFLKRQGDITKSIYKDLIFTGMGFNFNNFLNFYNLFQLNKSIKLNNSNNLFIVNETINFNNEPLLTDFISTILHNFNIKRNKISTKKNITFILRKNNRKITNIKKIKQLLPNINYIYLEDYTIKEQITIISNTNILIGVHGAGLSWCIFMRAKSLLIELYPGNSNTDNYIRWCKIANINYKRLSLPIINNIKNIHYFRNANVKINKNNLIQLLLSIKSNL